MDPSSARPRPRFTRLPAPDRRRILIEAALACIAEGGIQAFTVDRVCTRARVSRGLITHHFGTMDALLAAVYDHLYNGFLPPAAEGERILDLLDHLFAARNYNRQSLNVWLAMWSEISNRADLRAVHRSRYQPYVARIAAAIAHSAARPVEAQALAAQLICLIDGLDLQYCIDPDSMPADLARQFCLDLLTPHTGPLT